MTRPLLDVNAVIALVDPLHVHHERAHAWFSRLDDAWHTCPTVQNGALRILSHPRYPNTQPLPVVTESVGSLTGHSGHEFLPDGVSLAASAGALLATFDTKLVTDAVPGGAETLFLIP